MNRIMAAFLGGFVLSVALPLFMALFLPFGFQGNIVAAILLALPVWTTAVIWGYTAASVAKVWLGLGVSCTVLFAASVAKIFVFGVSVV